MHEKLSSAAFSSPIGICRLDEILKIFETCSFTFFISESISDDTGHGDADLFLLRVTMSKVSTSPFQNFAGNSQDLQHLLRILSTMLLSNTMIL